MARVEVMLQKMMRRFDASDEHAKEMRGDLAYIGKKMDAHAISIKHLDANDQIVFYCEPTPIGFSS